MHEAEIPELNESWFDRKNNLSTMPPPRSSEHPASQRPSEPPIGDALADDWFR